MRKYINNSNKIYIYTLSDPNNGEIKYVGKTNNVKRRYRDHIRESKIGKTYKCNWIKNLSDKPVIEIIDECSIINADFFEKYYISLFKNWGFKLAKHNTDKDNKLSYKIVYNYIFKFN